MAMFAEDAWKERLRDGVKVVVVVRRELVRVVALNIFKDWRAQVRGSRICPTNETSVQLRDVISEDGRRPGGGAELLQAGVHEGRRFDCRRCT